MRRRRRHCLECGDYIANMQSQVPRCVFCCYCAARFEDQAPADEPVLHLRCKSCGRTTHASRPLVGSVLVLTIVFAENQMLLIKRGVPPYRGFWAQPGGYVEAASRSNPAIRELNEEVALHLSA